MPTALWITGNIIANSSLEATLPDVTQLSEEHRFDHRNKTDTWKHHHRKQSPGVEWREKWTQESWKHGRVLLIDYVGKDDTHDGRRRIQAQEFHDVDGLRRYYNNTDLSRKAALRLIHVQNASWATRFLLRKFNIDHHNDLVGTTFGRWARYEKPQRRAGKPVLNGKAFRTQRDPWRGISRCAFGLDYLKSYDAHKTALTPSDIEVKMMELNGYDNMDNPSYKYDVFVQRLSVYIQRSEGETYSPTDPNIISPYSTEENQEEYRAMQERHGSDAEDVWFSGYSPHLDELDNGNTIIIFEHSQSGSAIDTLIGARQEIENRWRRLTFYLPKDDALSEDWLVDESMDLILKDIFKRLSHAWEKYLDRCETHVGILEDKIYENPADESRAPELWQNGNLWLKVEKLVYIHIDVAKEIKNEIKALVNDDSQDEWLENTVEDFEKLANLVQEDLVKPTANLSDLMYKSVEIRDSRHSIALGLSMWRLSWITFIFLPLTFMVGFFGMNVSTFSDESLPSIKWFFIAAIPFALVIVVGWYFVKHSLARNKQSPLRRGLYENLFHDLAADHPSMWSRAGPRETVVPEGIVSSIKWRLISMWYQPDKTIVSRGYDPGNDELGVWARTKRFFVRKWLSEIRITPASSAAAAADITETGDVHSLDQDLGAVTELLSVATQIGVGSLEPSAATVSTPPTGSPNRNRSRNRPRNRDVSPRRSRARGSSDALARPGSAHSSGGVMVEEESDDSDEGSEPEDAMRSERRRDERRRESVQRPLVTERLSVPIFPGRASEHTP
ncbi:hypothetical protein M501DRAFT_943318 [Patellaria atrata CBS 101060]|uniref:Uncharacterized protein n=1 Tax=Patellaria atrata CBS 101060 TaxID=1346257 RepID=A0A9P4S2A1_9PEZI|nr:hypothetical protein M501DRAFT_943318 [Patellaria atrata CBS 101060]